MINKKQERISDIVAEMRQDIADRTVGFWADFGGKIARCYADRIEAAEKREREAGAEAAQICGKIGELIGREAACKEKVTDCNHLGNAAKMREALSDACYAMFNFLKTQNDGYEEMAKALDKAKAALADLPRNCDIGTALEQVYRHSRRCAIVDHCEVNCRVCFARWSQMPYEKGEVK